jgi:hypothetical protein
VAHDAQDENQATKRTEGQAVMALRNSKATTVEQNSIALLKSQRQTK